MSLSTKQTQDAWAVPTFELGALRSLAEQQIELWQKMQSALLDAWQPAALGWFDHRRQGVEAASELLRSLCACKDLSEASTLQQKWLNGAVERLSADSRAMLQGALAAGQKGAALSQAAAEPPAGAASHAAPVHPRKVA